MPVQLRKRKADTHKGDYGHVVVVGGSTGLTGAVCLAANAAMRSGAGLVTAAVPKTLYPIFARKLTEVMSLPLADDGKGNFVVNAGRGLKPLLEKSDVLAAGCGLGRKPQSQSFIRELIAGTKKPMVVDADGLNALSGRLDILKRKAAGLVMTPHLGEFSRLTGLKIEEIKKKRKALAKEFALRYNLVLVLKGDRTLVSDGKAIFENTTGNPGMATAGSGDVLTGIIAGLMAQGISPYQAAKTGVYLHGLAGDLAAKAKTQAGLIARDIIDYLPKAIKLSTRALAH